MTDWMPWGLVVMAWIASTLALLIRALGGTPVGAMADLSQARRALWMGGAASLLAFLLYVVFQERWIWY